MAANGGIFTQRRGSFLVAVVAILSLLAVLTIVYVTVGRTDALLSAAVQRKSERGHPELVIRDHILRIIADDVTEPVDPSEVEGSSVEQLLIREAWDYPSTAYYATFYNPFTGIVERRPVTVGGDEADVAYFLPTGEIVIRDGMNEYIVGTGTDPWLSSTEPTWLDFAGDWTTANPEDYPRRRVDIPQISNVAPDGAFVNLFNLRAQQAGFDATPSQMRGDTGNNTGLTLYNPDNLTDGVNDRGIDTDYGYTIGSNSDQSYEAETKPFYWSSRQVGAHRPAGGGDPHFGPGDALYSPYQWADADGDGAFDARWFELVIDREPSPENDNWTDIFTRQGDLRYFFAVTVRDLSAMVNVNTATDGTLGSALVEPDGLTPAHIDLRRLLTLVDQSRDGVLTAAGLGSYGSLSDGSTDSYSLYTEAEAFELGDRAYDALRLAINEGAMPGVLDGGAAGNPGYEAVVLTVGGDPDNVDREFYFDSYYGGNGTGRTDHYRTIASLDPSAGSVWDSANNQYRSSPLFGLDSLAELLTFRRINDPSTASRLEMALHARGDFPAADPQAGFGPLRSDRRKESAPFYNATAGDAAARSDQFLAHSIWDIRGRLTTLSGHRPLYGADLILPTQLSAADLIGPQRRAASTQLVDIDTRTPLDRALLTDPEALFQIYADGLLPWSDLPGAWSAPVYATLAYAGNIHGRLYGPELALRSSAHLTVNMVDIADTDDVPTRRTVLVDESYRADLEAGAGREPAYPYILLDLNNADPNTGRLDPGGGGLIDPTGTYGRAINVFGIEAQPFITMAGTMAVYADATTAGGGNVEKAAPGPMPPTGPANALIPDLDSTFSASNADFLFEAIAVELTNPFDVPIELAGDTTTNGGFDYYIQFGDLYFRIAAHDRVLPETGTRSVFTLDPGQSRTVFCMSQTPTEVVTKLKSSSAGAVTPLNLDAWITAQFGADAALMWPMGTAAGTTVTPDLVDGTPLVSTDIPSSLSNGLLNILEAGGPSAAAAADRDVVRLWRAVRPLIDEPAGPAIDGSNESATVNDPLTDVLVDRLRVPTAEAGLLSNVRRTGGNQEIDGATPAQDGMGDNAGLTITQWAMIRRADDPDAAEFRTTVAASGTYRGVLPAWAFEPVDDSANLPRPVGEDSVVGPGDQLKIANFSAPENHGADTIADWFVSTETAAANDTIFPTITQDPADRMSDLVTAIVGTRVEHRLTTAGNSTISVPRLADLLLPLALGPMHDPGPDLADRSDDRWLTLAEALTFATTGLESVGPSPYADLDNFYDGVGVELTAGQGDTPLFYGQLAMERFVPFADVDSNGVYDPPALGGDDVAWGLRISPAMRIVQSVAGFSREQASLIRPIFGTLNINTAPLETLRSLPMLSPPDGEDIGMSRAIGGTVPMWWWDGLPGGPSSQTVDSDIATTLVGYRDRQRMLTRSTASGGLVEVVDFLGDVSLLNNDPPGWSPDDLGRGTAIGFSGTTERPGIRSIGELLGIRDYNGFSTGGATPAQAFDGLLDASDITVPGVAGTLYDNGSPDRVGDGVLDSGAPTLDYDQQFAIANSVFNTISIGSDYYAVWFLMHGYSEEDTMVTGAEPLVPTVARRFLMVVDRSGVTRRGDEPKIVLFREVPVALP